MLLIRINKNAPYFWGSLCSVDMLKHSLLNGKRERFILKRFFSSGKNFYDILNVKKNSNKNEIKQAYRKLALKYHPDRNPTNRKEAEQKFREITEAYETLSDDNKKRIYDSQLNGNTGFYSSSPNQNYSNAYNSNNNAYNYGYTDGSKGVHYEYRTRKMTDEEIENVFKSVFGNMNLQDIFKSNIFNKPQFTSRSIKGDFFENVGSFGSFDPHERTSNDPYIKQTNVKTEIIPRGNKIVERTTKTITYKDGKIKQEIIEREISNKLEDSFDFDFLKNTFAAYNNTQKPPNFYETKINRNVNSWKHNTLSNYVVNYFKGVLSIVIRRFIVNFVAQLIKQVVRHIYYFLRRR